MRKHILRAVAIAGATIVGTLTLSLFVSDPAITKQLKATGLYSPFLLISIGSVAILLLALEELARAHTPDPRTLDQTRQNLLDQVGEFVKRLLPLYDLPSIKLRLIDASACETDAVAAGAPGRAPSSRNRGGETVDVVDAYRRHGGRLLIEGPAGAGKTTLLAGLASHLLQQIADEDLDSIPVIFNLSGWGSGINIPPSLKEWLITELEGTWLVDPATARLWVDTKRIIPLLDGLDEVAVDRRQPCIDAIEAFCDHHAGTALVLTSRPPESVAFASPVRGLATMRIEPLTDDDVCTHLALAGNRMAGLLSLWETDTISRELLRSPLNLSLAMVSSQYRDDFSSVWPSGTREERLATLTRTYVEAMWALAGSRWRYSLAAGNQWLSSLASLIVRHGERALQIDALDVSWLPDRAGRLLCQTIAGLLIGFILGGAFALEQDNGYEALISGLVSGSICALLLVFRPRLSQPLPGRFRGFSLRRIRGRARLARKAALKACFAGGLLIGCCIFVFGLVLNMRFRPLDLINIPLQALVLGPFIGITVLFLTLTTEVRPSARLSDRRIRNSVGNAALAFLICGGIVGIVGAAIYLSNEEFQNGRALVTGIAAVAGTVAFAFAGGTFVVNNLAARLALWWNGFAPFRYSSFLDFAAQASLLRQVNEGYQFAHPTFLEYFTKTSEEPRQVSRRTRLRSFSACALLSTGLVFVLALVYVRENRIERLRENLADGELDLMTGEFAKSIADYRKALAIDSKSAAAHLGIASCLFSTKKYADAKSEFNRAITLEPENVEARLRFGTMLSSTGDYDAATLQLDKAVQLKPDYAAAHFQLGVARVNKGLYESAAAELKLALAQKYNSAEAHYWLAVALYSQGLLTTRNDSFDQAMGETRTAIAMNQRYAEAHMELGEMLYNAGRFAEAIAEFKQVITLKPGDGDAHEGLGFLLDRTGDYTGAVAEYRQSLAVDKSHGETYNNLGLALQHLGKRREAADMFRKGIASCLVLLTYWRPDDAQAHYCVAFALDHEGRTAAAIREYRAAIALNTGYSNANYDLGMALLKLHRCREAIQVFDNILQLFPQNPQVLGASGDAFACAGELGRAVSTYGRASIADPFNPLFHRRLASLYAKLGETTSARNEKQLSRALDSLRLVPKANHPNGEAFGGDGRSLSNRLP